MNQPQGTEIPATQFVHAADRVGPTVSSAGSQHLHPIPLLRRRTSLNVAGIIGGALPPLVAGPLPTAYGSWTIGLIIAVLVFTSFLLSAG